MPRRVLPAAGVGLGAAPKAAAPRAIRGGGTSMPLVHSGSMSSAGRAGAAGAAALAARASTTSGAAEAAASVRPGAAAASRLRAGAGGAAVAVAASSVRAGAGGLGSTWSSERAGERVNGPAGADAAGAGTADGAGCATGLGIASWLARRPVSPPSQVRPAGAGTGAGPWAGDSAARSAYAGASTHSRSSSHASSSTGAAGWKRLVVPARRRERVAPFQTTARDGARRRRATRGPISSPSPSRSISATTAISIPDPLTSGASARQDRTDGRRRLLPELRLW